MKNLFCLIFVCVFGSTFANSRIQFPVNEDISDAFWLPKDGGDKPIDASEPPSENPSQIKLRTVLAALRRALEYFQQNIQYLNLDGVIGTRMAQGQLKVLLKRLLASDSASLAVSTSEIKEMYNLMELAARVSEMAIPSVIESDLEYYNSVGRLLDEETWELDYPMRKTNSFLVWPVVVAEEILNETMSDTCLAQMMGTGQSEGHPCTPSASCWDMMTQKYSSRYSLTHEIIFLQLGESMGCWEEMKAHIGRRNQEDVWTLQEIFCANVLREMKENYSGGIAESKQDLFMEQAAVCGMYGYYDFFTFPWLKAILSWQKTEGCYGFSSAHHIKSKNPKRHFVKREEKKMNDGCLSHKSTVAIAVLAQYIRFLVEDPTLSGNTRIHSD